jgi:hypothetical protein
VIVALHNVVDVAALAITVGVMLLGLAPTSSAALDLGYS